MARVVLNFRPDVHGFQFINSFNFDATERAVLSGIGASASAALAGLFAPIPLANLAIPAVVAGYLAIGDLPVYGLCGGMAYASADCWRARVLVPRGGVGQPARSGAGGPLRALLWQRLLDSLGPGGVLLRTVEWMVLLNVVPDFLGGSSSELRRRSTDEFRALKSRIDMGQVVPIGLIGTSLAAWDQHQVLVYGYEEHGGSSARLWIYDPNQPHNYSDKAHDIADVDFGAATLTFSLPSLSRSGMGPVRGFFCSNYGFSGPPTGLAIRNGLFALDIQRSARTFMVTDGAKFLVSTPRTELAAFGVRPSEIPNCPVPMVISSTLGVFNPLPDVELLMDGSLLRDRTGGPTFLSAGGSLFLANAGAINFFGGAGVIRNVPMGSLSTYTTGPQHGQLLRELSATEIYLIDRGSRRLMTAFADFGPFGGRGAVKIVPDGSLAALPLGLSLPQPAAGECQRLATRIRTLEADLIRINALIDDAEPGRTTAGLIARRAITQRNLADAKGRKQVFGCP